MVDERSQPVTSHSQPRTLISRLRDPRITDLTEEDLGIFEDNADCEDLSDDEYEGMEKKTKADAGNDDDDAWPSKTALSIDVPGDVQPRFEPTTRHSGKPKGISVVDVIQEAREEYEDEDKEDHDGRAENEELNFEDDLQVDVLAELRKKNNTPVSLYGEYEAPKPVEKRLREHVSQGIVFPLAAQDRPKRCTSETRLPGTRHGQASVSAHTPALALAQRPDQYGAKVPRYFYVHQNTPVPMPPLKAWRGYNGSVYFEPIQVKSSKPVTASSSSAGPALDKCSKQLQDILLRNKRYGSTAVHHHPDTVLDSGSLLRDGHRSSVQSHASMTSTKSGKLPPKSRQMAVLDKQTIMGAYNEMLEDDVKWILGQESTGTLCLNLEKQRDPRTIYSKDKIYKGSVSHQVAQQSFQTRNKNSPYLSVNGGPYTSTGTSYSSSWYRRGTPASQNRKPRTNNATDLYKAYVGDQKKLPSLEQLTQSLRDMDGGGVGGGVGVGVSGGNLLQRRQKQHAKPYVKYGPEYRHRANPLVE